MAKICTTSLSVTVTGDGVSESFTPATSPVVNTAAPAGGPVDVSLSSGDNTITVPTGTKGFLIVPPSASAVAKKLKGAGGDTGFGLAPALPSAIMVPTGTATIIINAASAETVSIHWL